MESKEILSSFQFKLESTTALYSQLSEYLRHKIQSGVLKPGDKMIAENEVVELLKISRTTVRQAYEQLVDEGLIVRYRGKGTFVAEPRLKRNINYLYSFTENIRAAGAIPTSQILNCAVETIDIADRLKLGIDEKDTKVFTLERLRIADGKPLIVERTCIPYYLCPGIERVDFSLASLYATLRRQYGLNVCRAEETIEAVILKKSTCAQLDCPAGRPGYAIERVSYLANGFACEHTTSLTRADKCVFKLELTDNPLTREHAVDFKRQMQLVNPQE
ncbi:MAG: GntR family transcriptional regulator [Clostridia bacterium]